MSPKHNNCFEFDIYSPWMKIESHDWSDLTVHGKLKKFKKDTVLYHQQEYSNYVYVVKSGRVKLSVFSKDGSEKSLTIAEKGAIFGEVAALDNQPNVVRAVTLTDSEIFQIEKEKFKNKIQGNCDLAYKLNHNLIRKIWILTSQIQDLSFKSADVRVIGNLIKLSQKHGINIDDEYKIDVKFTHQEMADLTGLCRVTVSNIMSSLNNQGIIYKKLGYIFIKDMDKLLSLYKSN